MSRVSRVILVIEDSEEDFQTAKRLLAGCTDRPIARCNDAVSAMDLLSSMTDGSDRGRGLWPDVILLDLNMPGEDGRSLLIRLKSEERLKRIPVVIITTSSNPKDVNYCYENGAAGYIVKPVDLGRFRTSLEQMANYWLKAVTLPATGSAL